VGPKHLPSVERDTPLRERLARWHLVAAAAAAAALRDARRQRLRGLAPQDVSQAAQWLDLSEDKRLVVLRLGSRRQLHCGERRERSP
jgi:hypothetical protein